MQQRVNIVDSGPRHQSQNRIGTATSPLSANVLVLNRFYVAVHVVNVRRTLALLYREHAEVIHVEDDQYANYDFESWRIVSELRADNKQPHEDWIRSVNFELQVPRVIRLLNFERVTRQSLRFNRRNLFARDGYRCQYCGRSFPAGQLSLDHVLPRSRGGKTTWENVVCCCLSCNVKKGGRTPKEARMKLRSQPTSPKFSPWLARKLNNPKYAIWRSFLPRSLEVA